MKTLLLDTNVILRFVLKDNESQFREVEKLFVEAENKEVRLVVSSIVMTEVIHVLRSVYGKTSDEIARVVDIFIIIAPVILKDKNIWNWVLKEYLKSSLGIIDLFLIKEADGLGIKVFTFDKKLLNAQKRLAND